jgi:hypothetical protein
MCADETVEQHSLLLEYHDLPFAFFHQALEDLKYSDAHSHARQDFWLVVPPGHYEAQKGREIVSQYIKRLEARLSALLSQHSIAYWLHIYRRLAPSSIGRHKEPATIGLVRAVMEAAIQKYAQSSRCGGIRFSDQVEIDQIFGGLLLAPEFAVIRDGIKSQPAQLVLTQFGVSELMEFYEIEKIAYEVWRCGATLRVLGKGAPLIVNPQSEESFYDDRSEELNQLVHHHDSRDFAAGVSATGTVFAESSNSESGGGSVFLPVYNVNHIAVDLFSNFFSLFNLKVANAKNVQFNFIWFPFNLGGFYRAHLPFSEAYRAHKGVDFEWVVALLGALCYRVQYMWNEDPLKVLRFWKRAYEGPYTKQFVTDEIKAFLPASCKHLGLTFDLPSMDLEKCVSFLTLNDSYRNNIDLLCSGPHAVFLPFDDRLFIDYAWLQRTLYNLFYGVELSDQNFKGAALEETVRRGKSILPVGPCRALDGSKKQIDASFEDNDMLIIAECRAFGRSFGIDRGEPAAIQYRLRKVNEALRDIEGKGRWLASHAKGMNYDVSGYRIIIPVAVTPFREYIPSLNYWYWLTPSVSRVLSPSELDELLSDESVLEEAARSQNSIAIGNGR